MDYEKVKKQLDIAVDIFKKASEELHLFPGVTARILQDYSNVLIYHTGIEKIASIMNFELHEEKCVSRDGEEYWRYWFIYEGVEFAGFPNRRLDSFACRDREQNGC